MSKHHLWIFLGAAAVGYLFADKLVQYQPWKSGFTLVSNL